MSPRTKFSKQKATCGYMETALVHFEREEHLLDVYQVLDPYQLKLKLNVYDKNTYELHASAFCDETTLRPEL